MSIFVDTPARNVVTRSINAGSQSVDPGPAATPLMRVRTPCQWVDVVAKSGNSAVIWVGGFTVTSGIGIPLTAAGGVIYRIPIDDVSKVFIYGTAGNGVTFLYGTANKSKVLVNTDGQILLNTDGTPLENP